MKEKNKKLFKWLSNFIVCSAIEVWFQYYGGVTGIGIIAAIFLSITLMAHYIAIIMNHELKGGINKNGANTSRRLEK